jgi:hypothetical protein
MTTMGALSNIAGLWHNTGSNFVNVSIPGLPGVYNCSLAWGDYDNDGRLDFLFTGTGGGFGLPKPVGQLWHNQIPATNSPPAAPTGLTFRATTGGALLSWNSSPGMSYNVRAGSTPGGSDLLASEVNVTNGFRRVPAMGNAMPSSSLPLTGITNAQTIYWSVQAVNNSFTGGPFASETNFYSAIVTTMADSGPGSLRLAATNPVTPKLITFDPSLAGQTITLTSGQITLSNYGGPTQTMPPMPGSPAIDGCVNGTAFTTDQRGFPRVIGIYADIGAVEGVFNPSFPLTGATRLTNGAVRFGFANLGGPSYTVLAGTNAAAPLNTWSNLGAPVESPTGTFTFTDTQATNYPQRYYRVTAP